VVVVDDHPLWRHTVKSLIERAGAADPVWEVATGDEAVEAARARRPDVVIMDVRLPGMDGIEATRAITSAGPARVLVLSSSDDEEQVLDAVRAGATGYLLKTADPSEILEGLRRVHAGELVFPPSLTAIVLEELRGGRQRASGPLGALTDREVSVLALMAEGHTNETIGRTMHLSPKTVESHVTSIFMKLGLDPAAGGHRRVLAVITYLRSARKRGNPDGGSGRP
jgi:DNA-binding NarL/FixJ family response regulator